MILKRISWRGGSLLRLFSVLLTATILLVGGSASKVSANTVIHPANGVYSIQPQCAPKRELNVAGAYKTLGSNVIIYTIYSQLGWATNARWFIEQVDGDWYKITAEHSGLVLNVDTTNSNVNTVPYKGKAQLFRFVDVGGGYYSIEWASNPYYVLDVSNGVDADSTNVIIYPYHNGSNQKWKLVRL